jgi:Fic family protein
MTAGFFFRISPGSRFNNMSYSPDKPYNDLPMLFPAEKKWKTLAVLEAAIKAHRALAELKGRMSAIPNPNIFINTLALQEAKDSSSIENVFTTNEKLFKAFTASSPPDPQTKEVLRYGKTLIDAFASVGKSKKISVSLIESIYRNIKDEKDGIREGGVRIGNAYTTVYTPPVGKKLILEKLDNWLSFANNRREIDPLIKIAVLHYQFEAIHPFRDGNGRTGRILNALLLSAHELMDEPVLYLSRYINEYRTEYYRLLNGVTEVDDWEAWILYILGAVEQSAIHTLGTVLSIIDLMETTKEKIRKAAEDIYRYELIELLFTQVYCKYAFLEQNGIASRNTASKYLNRLVDLGILEKERVGNELIFKNKALYDLFRNI